MGDTGSQNLGGTIAALSFLSKQERLFLLSGGFSEVSRNERVQHARDRLTEALSDLPEDERKAYVRMHYQPYLLSVPLEDQGRHTRFIRDSDREGKESGRAACRERV